MFLTFLIVIMGFVSGIVFSSTNCFLWLSFGRTTSSNYRRIKIVLWIVAKCIWTTIIAVDTRIVVFQIWTRHIMKTATTEIQIQIKRIFSSIFSATAKICNLFITLNTIRNNINLSIRTLVFLLCYTFNRQGNCKIWLLFR